MGKSIRTSSKIMAHTYGKRNWSVFFISTFIVLFLAYLVNKNVEVPTIVLYVLTGIGFTFVALKGITRPEVIIYALVVYIPFSKILVGDFGGFATAINFTNILTILGIIAWFLSSAIRSRKFYRRTSLDIPTYLFMLVGCFSLMRGTFYFGYDYATDFIVPLKRWLTPIFFFFLVYNTVRDKETIKNIIVIIMIVTAVVALMAIKDYMDIGNVSSLEKSRVGGIAEQPNVLASFFVYYMFLYAGFFLVYWKKMRFWMLAIPFLLCFRGIQVTFSRGGYLAFAAAVLLIAFFKSRILFFFTILLAIFVLINPYVLPKGIQYRLSSTFHGEQIYSTSLEEIKDPSAARRIEIWKGAFEIIKDNFWFGIGYGVFPYMIAYYRPELGKVDAHNEYLLIASEMGIFGLLIFLLVLLIIIKNCFRLYRITKNKFFKAVALGFLGSLGGLLVVNMFGGRLDSQEVSSYFWIITALIFRALYIEREEQKLAVAKTKTRKKVNHVP